MAGRIRWAVEGLGLVGGERVLEVGPGHGVAIDLLASELEPALVVGLDRSAKMVAASEKRNAGQVADGKVRMLTGTPSSTPAELTSSGPFDRVLALRVRAFVDDPEHTLEPLLPVLAPGAEVHLIFDSPNGQGLEETGRRAADVMAGYGLRVRTLDLETGAEFKAVRAVGVAGGR